MAPKGPTSAVIRKEGNRAARHRANPAGDHALFERLKTAASAEWRAYTEHPFTTGMADGTLTEPAFRHYLVQDYLFLIEFARAYALSVYKSPKLADMREAAAGLSAIPVI